MFRVLAAGAGAAAGVLGTVRPGTNSITLGLKLKLRPPEGVDTGGLIASTTGVPVTEVLSPLGRTAACELCTALIIVLEGASFGLAAFLFILSLTSCRLCWNSCLVSSFFAAMLPLAPELLLESEASARRKSALGSCAGSKFNALIPFISDNTGE